MDSTKIFSCFNHHFHMAYRMLEIPYTIPIGATIQIYLNAMDALTAIIMRRLPLGDIDILNKVFEKVITFMKQSNPNGGGMMLPTQEVTMMPTYPVGAPKVPS